MSSILRTMNPGDIPSILDMSAAANWNQTPADWRRILQLSPQGCRAIIEDGKIVATISLLPYSKRLAWIGMLLTRPEYQRRGHARRLMEDAISCAEHHGIRTLKLDATDEGRPLYERLGFVVETSVERWACDAGNFSAPHGMQPAYISDDLFSLDTKAFGAPRTALLQALSASGECTATAMGYALSRPGSNAHYLGPCIATSEAEALRLLAVRLNRADAVQAAFYWDLLPSNPAAVRCAATLGFTRRRRLWRMRRGDAIENNDALVYAIAGFELG